MGLKFISSKRASPLLLYIVLAGLPPVSAYAAEDDGRFAVHGVGRAACADFTRVRAAGSAEYRQFGGWISGYITALNQMAPKTFDLVAFETLDTLSQYISNYCQKNPKSTFIEAARAVTLVMGPTKIEKFEGFIEFPGQPPIRLYKQVAAAAVARLRQLGHAGDIDPHDVEAMSAALQAFQADNGLEQTGRPDQVTLSRLIRTPP